MADLTAGEVATRLGKSKRTIARLVARGVFPHAYKFGGYPSSPLVIPERDVIAYEKQIANQGRAQNA